MRKSILAGVVCLVIHSVCFSQNLVGSQSWTIGSGSVGVFSENGVDSQNIREMGTGPFGSQTILWKAVADAANGPDGGWNTSNFSIDNTKMYRFSVWIKKTNSTDGTTYFGCGANDILSLAGSVDSNPYFWVGDLPQLDRWYLLVGYVHGSGDASTTSYGGVYDGVTGAKVAGTTDFKFSSSATYGVHRAYLYYDLTTSDRQYFYGPEVYKVDQAVTETFLPNMTSGNAFFGGNVGIGTTTLTYYPLEVRGPQNGWGAFFANDLSSVGSPYPAQASVWGTGINSEARLGFGTTQTTGALAHTGMIKTIAPSDGGGTMIFQTRQTNFNSLTERMRITNAGLVGIGTTSPDFPLTVNGSIHAKEVRVDLTGALSVPDYVFEKDYKLTSLEDIKTYIDQNKHLPEVPSAKEIEKNGVQLGEMNLILLKKIEELTLYIIKQEEHAKQQDERIKNLEAEIKRN